VTSARTDLLKPVALFAALDAASLRKVTAAARIRETKAGDSFFREGDPAESFFVVQAGSVKLTQVTPEGHQACCDSSVLETHLAALRPSAVSRIRSALKR
jgi:cyclic nucleotide-binding protein